MKPLRLSLLLLVVALLTGCATSRSVITPGLNAGQNPADGVAVRIDSVADARRFEAAPATPDIPSVMEGEISNASLTARAIGRKRNGYGKAMGDVVLPEGQTVSSLVSAALTRGLREAGYRVIAKGDAGYEQAIPVSARVDQFWAWFNPGFASVKVSSKIDVAVTGKLKPLESGRPVSAETSESMQMVTENDWLAIINKGLEAWVAKLKTSLRP
ncbi:MAG TPA: flagellar biosynthesis protein [Burkholderiales bacterium]|nr:flagellar biosynthesis protein [Burkholderiales bacterium]